MTESGVKSKGNGTKFELAGEFELSEFELLGFHCSNLLLAHSTSYYIKVEY